MNELVSQAEVKCIFDGLPVAAQELFIPCWHPIALNKLMGHWAERAKRKAGDRAIIWGESYGARRATGKRRVSLEIILGHKQRGCDPDAYWKSLLDALVHAKLLINDNRQNCELGPVTFSRDAKRWGTRVTLEDLGGV